MKMNGLSHRGEWPRHAAVPEGDRSCPSLPSCVPKHADPVAASAGVVSESEHESLRADIRPSDHHARPDPLPPRWSGEAAGAGRGGRSVRRLSRQAPESGRAEITNALSGLDSGTAVALRRAFSQYFQPRTPPSSCTAPASCVPLRRRTTPLHDLMQLAGRGVPREARAEVRRPLELLECGRCPAAHPYIVAPVGAECTGQRAGSRRQHRVQQADSAAGLPRTDDGSIAGLVDLLWQTDEIRPASPRSRTRRARSAGTWSSCAHTVPSSSACSSAATCRRFTRPGRRAPLVLGSWVGGDRDGNPSSPRRHPSGHRVERSRPARSLHRSTS